MGLLREHPELVSHVTQYHALLPLLSLLSSLSNPSLIEKSGGGRGGEGSSIGPDPVLVSVLKLVSHVRP